MDGIGQIGILVAGALGVAYVLFRFMRKDPSRSPEPPLDHSTRLAKQAAHAERLARLRAAESGQTPEEVIATAPVSDEPAGNRMTVGSSSHGSVDFTSVWTGVGIQGVKETHRSSISDGWRQAMEHGGVLMRLRKFEEACRAFEGALLHVGPDDTERKYALFGNLAVATLLNGKPAEALEWARKAIEAGASGETLATAYAFGGMASAGLGDLDGAERLFQAGFTLATEAGNLSRVAQFLAGAGRVQSSRGNLTEAFAAYDQSLAIQPDGNFDAHMHRYGTLRVIGRLEDAKSALAEARKAAPTGDPIHASWLHTSMTMMQANLFAEEEAADDAFNTLSRIASTVRSERILSVSYIGLLAWIEAMRGNQEEAARFAEQAHAACETQDLPRGDRMLVLSYLVRALIALEEYEGASRSLAMMLDLKPEPLNLVGIYFFLGECHRELGDRDAARKAYGNCVALDIDIPRARLAQERLDES